MRFLGLAVTLVALVVNTAAARAVPTDAILFSRASIDSGSVFGTQVDGGQLVLEPGQTSGRWTSASIEPGFAFTRLVASWNADTPAAGHIRVEVQAITDNGALTNWYTLAIWAADDHAVQRSTVRGQADADGRVDTDTLYAGGNPFVAYSLRLTLERAAAEDPSPSVRMVGAQVSNTAFSPGQPTSLPLSYEPVELPVPAYSQEIHARQYPQYGGGGEAWCSPTSTEMVVEYWDRGPGAADLAWVDSDFADPAVDHAARSTYDAAYRGTGNWPFNTAYAARFGLNGFVTQLRSLAEAEQLIRGGVPLVASIASQPQELTGFLFDGGTNGHLVVVIGFDGAGNPIVNDPAAWSNATVRRVYDRAQFERVWLRGSSGTVYVIHPPELPLPAPPADATPNW
jgi:hypothetical protein